MHSWNEHVILAACVSPCYCTLTIAQQYAGGEIEDGSMTASAAKCCQKEDIARKWAKDYK